MARAAQAIARGAEVDTTLGAARAAVLAAGFSDVEYLELRDGVSLAPLDGPEPGARLFAAAWLAGIRLIDNIAI
jgi:pantoate--beta-alanine ligase